MSVNTESPAEELFSRAQSLGWTRWEYGASHTRFLKEAVSHVYDSKAGKPRSSRSLGLQSNGSAIQPNLGESANLSRKRQAALAADLVRSKCQDSQELAAGLLVVQPRTFADERPLSSFHEVVQRLAGSSTESIQENAAKPPTPGEDPLTFRDPVDIAMHRIVDELGFSQEDAKWALKQTDTGESIDVDAAVDLLLRVGSMLDPSSSRLDLGLGRNAKGALSLSSAYSGKWRPVWRWA